MENVNKKSSATTQMSIFKLRLAICQNKGLVFVVVDVFVIKPKSMTCPK